MNRLSFRTCKTTCRSRTKKIERFFFLSQPFSVAEVFTGFTGKYVGLAEIIRGFQLILPGDLDGLPEQAFYLVSNIDEVWCWCGAPELRPGTTN